MSESYSLTISPIKFGTMVQMPEGHAAAQKPQPMQCSSSTMNLNVPVLCSTRLMAFWPQMDTQMLQSRQVPHEMQRSASESGSVGHWFRRGVK